jgi:hypothetical protein
VRRPLYGWLASEVVSITGTRVSMIALPFFVLATTGSAQKAGLAATGKLGRDVGPEAGFDVHSPLDEAGATRNNRAFAVLQGEGLDVTDTALRINQ